VAVQALLLITFFVHILFLNVTLGGTAIGAVHGLLATGQEAHGRRLGRVLASLLPASVSFTVTTGVAPCFSCSCSTGRCSTRRPCWWPGSGWRSCR